jgi:hypothetical protein
MIARGGMFEVVGVATIAAGAIVETLAGGTALVRGAVHNSGGTLLASGASSLIEIVSGAVVSGGPVEIGNGTALRRHRQRVLRADRQRRACRRRHVRLDRGL